MTQQFTVKTEWRKRPVDQIFPEGYQLKCQGKCPTCKRVINPDDFKDDLSYREYQISGMCPTCQGKVFRTEVSL